MKNLLKLTSAKKIASIASIASIGALALFFMTSNSVFAQLNTGTNTNKSTTAEAEKKPLAPLAAPNAPPQAPKEPKVLQAPPITPTTAPTKTLITNATTSTNPNPNPVPVENPNTTQSEAAKPVPALMRVSGTEELDALRAQNAILAEQVKNYELKTKMGLTVPAIDQNSPIPLARGGVGMGAARTNNHGAIVTMVAGQKDRLVATIQTADGGMVAVRVGDTVPNFGKVKTISVNQVLVETGKKSAVSIPFAQEPMNTVVQGSPQAGGMPNFAN